MHKHLLHSNRCALAGMQVFSSLRSLDRGSLHAEQPSVIFFSKVQIVSWRWPSRRSEVSVLVNTALILGTFKSDMFLLGKTRRLWLFRMARESPAGVAFSG
jgi:hypothetical protein